MKQYCISIIALLCFIGCTSNDSGKEYTFLTQSLENSDIHLENYKYIVILPGSGCHGCIQEGEFFLKQNVSNKSILFILSNPTSLKILQNKLQINIKNQHNIIIDKSSRFNVPTKNSIYPCVIFLDSRNKIRNIIFQKPQSRAFYELYRELSL